MLSFDVNGRKIGKGHPVFVIAEVSANHGQDFDRAVKMIEKAKECGADAVKFQTYTPDTMTIDVNNKYFQVNHHQWGGQTLYQLYKKGNTPWEWTVKLKKICDDLGIIFFSSAFDKTSVDLLEDLNVSMHKISSFEIVDLPLIEYVAKTKKPLILSTGMASSQEIKEAVDTARGAGAEKLLLLKCVSSYPASPEEMNLKTIPDMAAKFECPVGLSDHTLSNTVALTSVAVGAVAVEKHFILSRKITTPDSFFSIDQEELKELIESIRTAEKALGGVHYGVTNEEKGNLNFRRSLFVVKDIKAGEKFSEDNIRSIRPGNGLMPKHQYEVVGKKAKKDIKKGSPLKWTHIR
mgnify:CR=1 FL=1